jgi:hypothetical protein|tara:strand:+ start:97 stop:198 length:102 start_codon:yes stop_codon:yes gene_type:complete
MDHCLLNTLPSAAVVGVVTLKVVVVAAVALVDL